MAKPPDLCGITIDKSKSLKLPGFGPKFLIISRKSEAANNKESLDSVSPFLIKKVIDSVCGEEVEMCKKIRNGTLLIKTKNYMQASKLIQLTSFSPSIKIEGNEHNFLNYAKGIFYSNSLRGIDENEILQELKTQNVCEVKKLMKLSEGSLVETGLLIITFATITLPTHISIGYEKINVRPYVPLPLKCKQCHRFGHTANFCKHPTLCSNCSNFSHTEVNQNCTHEKSCINCREANCDNNHAPSDKKCPIFLKEKEIQAIVTLEKKDKKEAIRLYHARHQLPINSTFSTVIKNGSNKENSIRPLVNYSGLSNLSDANIQSSDLGKSNYKIATRSMSTYKKSGIKKKIR